MPTELKVANPEQLAALISTKHVCHPSVGPVLADVGIEGGQTFAGDALAVNVRGTLSIRAFNSSDDTDDDGILGVANEPMLVGNLPPQLALGTGSALLKYKGAASIKARAAGQTLQSLGFAIEGGLDVLLTDYHRHPCATPTRDAVLSDITALRTSLRLDDVIGLGVGEAVSHQVVGRLSAAVEMSWADIFTGSLGPLLKLTGAGVAVLVKVAAGASVKASVSITDDFLLVFSKATASRWRLGVRKARTRGAALGIDLGMSVAFENPAQIRAILSHAIEGVLGAPRAKVDALLKKASLDALSDAERRIADILIERLGLTPAVATIEALRAKVQAVFDGIDNAVRDVATAKIALAFGYEYRRLRQDVTVAQCLLDEDALRRYHKEVVRGRIGDVFADAAAGGAGLTLEHFLYQKTIRSERSWGFALSIGKWLTLGGKDRKVLTRVDRQTADGAIQRAYIGSRGYRDQGDATDHWSADLSAAMPGYSNDSTPKVSAFEVGLAVNWAEPKQRLTEETLRAWLDLGVLWGAIPESQVGSALVRLLELGKVKATMVAQMTVPHEAFSAIRPRIAAASASAVGDAFAAAMPWMKEPGRTSPSARRAAYGGLWSMYLGDPDNVHRNGRDFAQTARRHLEQQGFRELASMERLYEVAPTRPHDGQLFCGLIDLNTRTIQQCNDFVGAIRRLHADTVSAAPDHGVFPRVFEGLDNFWAQGHHVRAAGAYLLEVARQAGVAAHVARSLSITVGDGADAEVVVLGS